MSRYAEAHANRAGPGDTRPTALQIINDEGLEGTLGDKVFRMTGASSGIGIETGRALAATGAKGFLAVRDLKKGEESCQSFLEPGRVELIELDVSSVKSVRATATALLQKGASCGNTSGSGASSLRTQLTSLRASGQTAVYSPA
jgi:hypothetical protein